MWRTLQALPSLGLTEVPEVILLNSSLTDTDKTLVHGTVKVKISGDVNSDGKVDVLGLFNLSRAYGSILGMPNWNPDCDFNRDNKIDASDLFELNKNYGKAT